MMRSLLTGLILISCGGGSATTPAKPDPYLADEATLNVPDLETAAIEAALAQAVQTLFTLDPTPIIDGYHRAMSGQDEACPAWATSGEGDRYWYSTCESDDGTQFDGFGLYKPYENYTDEGGNTLSGAALMSISTIRTPDGLSFESSGGLNNLFGVNSDGMPIHFVQIEDGFSWNGPEAAGTWLEEGIQPDIQMYGFTAPGIGHSLVVNGSISGIHGVQAVVFDELTAIRLDNPSDCAPEPNGLISLRDLDGNWTDLEFTGPTADSEATDENGCDQCAVAWFKGIQLGDVCPDMSPLFEWEGPMLW